MGISLILHVLEATLRHITNGDTGELVINEVINKETLEREQKSLCSISKDTYLCYWRYITLLTLGWASLSLTLFRSSREGRSWFHRDGHLLDNTLGKDLIVLISMAFNFYDFKIFGVQHQAVQMYENVIMLFVQTLVLFQITTRH